MREADLEPKIVANIGLGGDLVVEVVFNSISEDSLKATKSILAIEVAALETSTSLAAQGNALPPAKGKDARRATSSSVGPSDEIV